MAVAVAGRVPEALPALIGFMAVCGIANVVAFAAIAKLRGRTALADFAGLFSRSPMPVLLLTVAFLSLAGLPPLAGFLCKLALFTATLKGGLGWLAIVAVANTVLSLFYYLRVIGPAVFAPAPFGPVATLGGSTTACLWLSGAALLAVSLVCSPFWASLPPTLLP
ncbi:hypothetical protein ILP92_01875 [Maribius pontilimi]|uniref:NADH:quinone oxidoreductase/Mrp antiporter transmembrane domain-containing protein n=1 Tax=Palleronia pontilimi TaxID=1964209 RepID=A0A934IDI4_9RHOB|nr:hypothetical protein [Palleronia pontilimi]